MGNMRKRDDENYDCSSHAILWQDLITEPSSTIPKGSRGKCSEVPRTQMGDDIVRSVR